MIQAPGENLKKLFCGNIFSLFCKLHRFTALGKLFAMAKWSDFRKSLIKYTPKKVFLRLFPGDCTIKLFMAAMLYYSKLGCFSLSDNNNLV